jgi:hypothetical protein
MDTENTNDAAAMSPASAGSHNTDMATARLSAANTWLQEEIKRLRLTDAEAEAIESAIKWIEYPDPENESMIYGYKSVVAILRDVLRRCS